MVAIMNTDDGTAAKNRTPRNRTPKGIATASAVDLNNQFEMFKRSEVGPTEEPPYSLWYLCIFDNGKLVRAELSRPSGYAAGTIVKFDERIFILGGGDWEKIVLEPEDKIGSSDEVEINIRRK